MSDLHVSWAQEAKTPICKPGTCAVYTCVRVLRVLIMTHGRG